MFCSKWSDIGRTEAAVHAPPTVRLGHSVRPPALRLICHTPRIGHLARNPFRVCPPALPATATATSEKSERTATAGGREGGEGGRSGGGGAVSPHSSRHSRGGGNGGGREGAAEIQAPHLKVRIIIVIIVTMPAEPFGETATDVFSSARVLSVPCFSLRRSAVRDMCDKVKSAAVHVVNYKHNVLFPDSHRAASPSPSCVFFSRHEISPFCACREIPPRASLARYGTVASVGPTLSEIRMERRKRGRTT